jgi:RNA polymerase sigma factor (sigma-70 family)
VSVDRDVLKLIKLCKKGDRRAQFDMYGRFSGLLFAVALRYTNTKIDAEDVVQNAWVKIFSKLDSFSENNSFEGWMRRIVVNTAITLYRKNQKHANQLDIDDIHATPQDLEASITCDFTREELERAIARLPEGYGLVFKLYVIDGYKHKEIAEMLSIEINTSKSQLSRAKKNLQNALCHMEKKAQPQAYKNNKEDESQQNNS